MLWYLFLTNTLLAFYIVYKCTKEGHEFLLAASVILTFTFNFYYLYSFEMGWKTAGLIFLTSLLAVYYDARTGKMDVAVSGMLHPSKSKTP